jgi:hypothetical protein
MASPVIHAAVTGGIAALYLHWDFKEAKKEGSRDQWNMKSRWGRWTRRIFVLLAIIFLGVFIDADHFVVMILPRGMLIEVVSGSGGEAIRRTIIMEPVFWLHSSYAIIIVLLLRRLFRSCLPLIALASHLVLDLTLTPILGNLGKPIFKDLYLLIAWLTGGS